ncbi:MAG: hypothetical protein ACO3U0_07535 [Ilumatobacteraceae bacterium]
MRNDDAQSAHRQPLPDERARSRATSAPDPTDIDSAVVRGELAVLEDLCHEQRRREPQRADHAEVRDLAVVVRGQLPDGRLLWSGEEFTFGILTSDEVHELGLDPTGRQRSLATVASRGCRHVLARVLINRLPEPVVER